MRRYKALIFAERHNAQALVAEVAYTAVRICIGAHSSLEQDYEKTLITDMDVALAVLKLERALLLGTASDAVDPARPIECLRPWWRPLRERALHELGPDLTRGMLLACAGQLPSWAIDRMALLMRALMCQCPHAFPSWLRAALAEPMVPEPGVSDSRKLSFIKDIADPANLPVTNFKKVLKAFCGGKRKGEKADVPAAAPRTRDVHVTA